MASKAKSKLTQEDQLLRQAFDVSYVAIDKASKFDAEEAVDRLRSIDRRTRILIVVVAASLIAVISSIYLSIGIVNYLNWLNRPTFMERLAAPYELESRLGTLAAGAGEYLVLPAAPGRFEMNPTIPVTGLLPAYFLDTAYYTPETIPERYAALPPEVLEKAIPEDSVVLNSATMTYFVTNTTLVGTLTTEEVRLTVMNYVDDETASTVMLNALGYSRQIGRLGNFNVMDAAPVPYFYSSTRDTFTFTWRMNAMVFSLSGTNWGLIDEFANQFALNQLTWSPEEPVYPLPAMLIEATEEANVEEATAEPGAEGAVEGEVPAN